ncbi:YybS family protein [Alkalicoccus halolimnae]|uniref:YybS family protein n=1 Tax=Alkalicoccus halolimnae TaxID=1667239 RepID=A0A5C7F7V4_9BACI|nr:YybS family protein [Alkalicoccus halolimnae]TXF86751.1 DUF2232 domain-containing protein [Alkalicoccus halolimnae]
MDKSSVVRDGVVAAGIFMALVLAALLIPFAGLILLFFIPVPMVIYTYKYGWQAGVFVSLFILMLLSLVVGAFSPIVIIIFASAGIAIGELYKRGESAFGVYAGTALSVVLGIVITYVGIMALTDTDPVRQLQLTMEESMETTENVLGIEEDPEAAAPLFDFIDNISVIVPALLVITGAVTAFVMQLVSIWYLRKRDYSAAGFPPLREWSLPKSFIWYYLLAIILSFINISEGQEGTLNTLASNLNPVMEGLMVIQGLAFIFFFFHWKKLNIVLPIIITLSVVVFPFLLPIIRILGIIDLGFDLRTRLKSQK